MRLQVSTALQRLRGRPRRGSVSLAECFSVSLFTQNTPPFPLQRVLFFSGGASCSTTTAAPGLVHRWSRSKCTAPPSSRLPPAAAAAPPSTVPLAPARRSARPSGPSATCPRRLRPSPENGSPPPGPCRGHGPPRPSRTPTARPAPLRRILRVAAATLAG